MVWKYAANLQENSNVKVCFQWSCFATLLIYLLISLLISLLYWYLYFTVFIKHLRKAVSENSNLKNVAIWKCNNVCDGLIFSTYIALTITSHQEKITLYLNSFPNSETIECESNCYKNSSYLKKFLYSENVKVTTKSWYFQI